MTDVSNLDELAGQIASGKYPNIATYAKAQVAATQAQELVIRKMAGEVEVLKAKAGGGGGAPPPPPVVTAAKFWGYVNLGGQEWPVTHMNDYRAIWGPSSQPGMSQYTGGKSLLYMSAVSCSQTPGINYGVTYAQANANGWILSDAAGQLYNAAYPTNFLGNAGLTAYRAAWCANVDAILTSTGADGFVGDDVAGWIQVLTNANRFPSQHPTDAAWYAALLGFCQYVGNYFQARGKYVSWNAGNWKAGDGGSDNGVRTTAFWHDLAPTSSGLMNEDYLAPYNSPRVDKIRYQAGAGGATNWYDYWDEWRALHALCNSYNIDLIGIFKNGYGYVTASFLLGWDGVHGICLWSNTPESAPYTGDTDSWDAYHTPAVNLGAPTAAAVKTGNVWSRTFVNGTVTVNPTLGTWTMTGV